MKQNKSPAMLVLGIVAVLAVMSLILMFTQENPSGAYGAKVYGGGAKEYYGRAGYYAPYEQGGTYQQVCNPDAQGALICHTIQAAVGKGTTDPRSLREIPTWVQTQQDLPAGKQWQGPSSRGAILALINTQGGTMHCNAEGCFYAPPAGHQGALDKMI